MQARRRSSFAALLRAPVLRAGFVTRQPRPRGAEALAAALQSEKNATGVTQAAALARREQAVRAAAYPFASLQT